MARKKSLPAPLTVPVAFLGGPMADAYLRLEPPLPPIMRMPGSPPHTYRRTAVTAVIGSQAAAEPEDTDSPGTEQDLYLYVLEGFQPKALTPELQTKILRGSYDEVHP